MSGWRQISSNDIDQKAIKEDWRSIDRGIANQVLEVAAVSWEEWESLKFH